MSFVSDLSRKAGLIFIGVVVLAFIIVIGSWIIENIYLIVVACLIAISIAILCLVVALVWKAMGFVYETIKKHK